MLYGLVESAVGAVAFFAAYTNLTNAQVSLTTLLPRQLASCYASLRHACTQSQPCQRFATNDACCLVVLLSRRVLAADLMIRAVVTILPEGCCDDVCRKALGALSDALPLLQHHWLSAHVAFLRHGTNILQS